MQAPGRRVPSDYDGGLGRQAVLAPPTCCSCCCCCCTLAVPEVAVGAHWARRAEENFVRNGIVPPVSEVLWAYAGGIVAGNLIFWIGSFILGMFLYIMLFVFFMETFGSDVGWIGPALVPLALVVALGFQGSRIGARVARGRREDPATAQTTGALVGMGMGVLVTGSVAGVAALVAIPIILGENGMPRSADDALGFSFFVAGLACLVGAIMVVVRGSRARRGRLEPR